MLVPLGKKQTYGEQYKENAKTDIRVQLNVSKLVLKQDDVN